MLPTCLTARLAPLTFFPILAFSSWATACGGTDETERSNYTSALLDEYKTALPKAEDVEATVPGPTANPNALGILGDAELAKLAIKSAVNVNAPARLIVSLLRKITKIPPTLYDSEKKEFLWGPWDNEDDHGQVLVYIRENPQGEDFKYGYALVRLVDSDLDTKAPVIWGGGTPGESDERGVGATLWDFEANNAFSEEHDPAFDPDEPRDHGRFAMVFGRGEEDNGEFAFNVAVIRDFISKDAEAGAEPADLDYFFGHFEGDDGGIFDFLDWSLLGNLCEADPETCFKMPVAGASETLVLRAAFVNRGTGRAEASVTGGDLAQPVSVVECWDDDIDRTEFSVRSADTVIFETGACEAPFDATLADLGVPTLSGLDQELLEKMDCLATQGVVAACEADE